MADLHLSLSGHTDPLYPDLPGTSGLSLSHRLSGCVCVLGLCLPFCVLTLSHLPWKAPEGGGVAVAVLPCVPRGCLQDSYPVSFADSTPLGRVAAPLLPHQLPLSFLASIKEMSHSPCGKRHRPSYSNGMSFLVPCPALSCPLACPVTGSMEGRDVGNIESPGIAAITWGVQEQM